MKNHTPGPWIVGGHPKDGSGTAWREVVSMGTEFKPSYICAAVQEDAQLIAAAPDLLAILKQILYAHDTGNCGASVGEAWLCRAYASMARDAIKKAEGN